MSARGAAGIVALAVTATLFLSGLASFRERWDAVGQQRLKWAATPVQPDDLGYTTGAYDPGTLVFWRENVHRGDRYYLNVPKSSTSFPDLASALSMIAGYALLPGQRVLDPRDATVILTSTVDPKLPGVRYQSTITNGAAAVSRVQR